jgi:hypothetical protein
LHQVFVSFDEEDKELVQSLAGLLELRGYGTWFYTRDSVPGLDYPTQISEALEASQVVLLIVSYASLTSSQVRQEVALAHEHRKRLMPLRVGISHDRFAGRMPTAWQLPLGAAASIEVNAASVSEQLSQIVQGLNRYGVKPAAGDAKPRPENGPVATPRKPEDPPKPKVQVPKDLSAEARAVIEVALRLAAKCGAEEITHRIFLAAFLENQDSFASRVCAVAGVDTRLLHQALVQLSRIRGAPRTDPTSTQRACPASARVFKRIVEPTLNRARQAAGALSEAGLFRAFCECATPAFVNMLKSPAPGERSLDDPVWELLELDLQALGAIDPDRPGLLARLTLRSRGIIECAYRLALEHHVCPIPNRLILAAFLFDEQCYVWQLSKRLQWPVQKIRDALIRSVDMGTDSSFPLDEASCAHVAKPVIDRACEIAGSDDPVTQQVLFRAFCEKVAPALKASLKKMGFDLDALCHVTAPSARNGASGPAPDGGGTLQSS